MEIQERLTRNLKMQIKECIKVASGFDMEFRINVSKYPVEIEYSKRQDMQISMIEEEKETLSIVFLFGVDICIDIDYKHPISESVIAKLKGAAKKCVVAYYMLLHFINIGALRDLVEKIGAEAFDS